MYPPTAGITAGVHLVRAGAASVVTGNACLDDALSDPVIGKLMQGLRACVLEPIVVRRRLRSWRNARSQAEQDYQSSKAIYGQS